MKINDVKFAPLDKHQWEIEARSLIRRIRLLLVVVTLVNIIKAWSMEHAYGRTGKL